MADNFFGPRSRHNARLLLDAAAALGVDPTTIRTQAGGYLVPQEILDLLAQAIPVEEGTEYPAPVEATPQEEVAPEATTVTEEVAAPKRPGKNDSKATWEEYISTLGIAIPDGATKDDLFALVDTAEKENN